MGAIQEKQELFKKVQEEKVRAKSNRQAALEEMKKAVHNREIVEQREKAA